MELVTLKISELSGALNYRDVGDTSDLVTSLAKLGQKIPIDVLKQDGKYIIKDGHRRVAALRELQVKEVIARIVDPNDDKERLLDQLAINNIRKADGYILAKKVSELCASGKKQEEIAAALGHDRAWVSQMNTFVLPNVAYDAYATGADLYVKKNDDLVEFIFSDKAALEKAGHDSFDFDRVKGIAEPPALWSLKPLLDLYRELDSSNKEHMKQFSLATIYLIRKGLNKKEDCNRLAGKVRKVVFGAAAPVHYLNPQKVAKKIAGIFVGGAEIEDMRAFQKAIRVALKTKGIIKYDVIVREKEPGAPEEA